MSEFQNKNDYSVAIFNSSGFLVKVQYVHNIYKLCLWLETSKYKDWTYINIYVRRSQRFLKRHYKGNFIEQKPRF